MIDDSEEIEKSAIERYIAGIRLPDYSGYCPIVRDIFYKQPDGRFFWADYSNPATNSYFEEAELIEGCPGFLVVHLGDALREHTVETAATALHATLKSLFAACDIPVDLERFRTTVELSAFMNEYRGSYSHLILIGHASPDGLRFLDKQNSVKGAELAGMLGADNATTPLHILSLCCHSGCEAIARPLSRSEGVIEVIAPSETFDMRWAANFVTGYFLSRYIGLLSSEQALKDQCRASKMKVCIWRSGEILECASEAERDETPAVTPATATLRAAE